MDNRCDRLECWPCGIRMEVRPLRHGRENKKKRTVKDAYSMDVDSNEIETACASDVTQSYDLPMELS